jgi:glucose/arabinose dehydrogenase
LAALGDRLYVTDGNHETITEVTLDGKLRRLVELPESNRVLVGIAAGPDGALYVAEYGPFPQVEGSARVSRAGLDGSYVPAEMGLTTAIALAFDPLGVLHVVEFSSGRRQSNTGRLVRRLPDGKTQVVVGGLSFPTGIAIAPDGTIYVSDRGHVSEGGSGRVVRIRPPGAIDRIADGLRSRFGWLFGSG